MAKVELTFTFVVDEEQIKAYLGQRVTDVIKEFNDYYVRFPSEAVRFIRMASETTSVEARLHE